MSFDSRFFKGVINAEVYDPILVLASLHVREHFNRRHAAAASAAS
jgi:hypothetical protein